jgi:hypothetical protein
LSIVLRFSNLWSSATARADGIAIDSTSGLYVNNGAINGSQYSGIQNGQGTYLGTAYCYALGVVADAGGFSVEGFVKRHLFNAFNRMPRPMLVFDSTDTWNYSTASYQQANANTSNQLDFVVGLSEEPANARVMANVISSGATGRAASVGIGVDSTTVNSANIYETVTVTNAQRRTLTAEYIGWPGIGRRTLVWLERGAGTDTQTWSGDTATTTRQTGMVGQVFG